MSPDVPYPSFFLSLPKLSIVIISFVAPLVQCLIAFVTSFNRVSIS
jgi:hypothetical protein